MAILPYGQLPAGYKYTPYPAKKKPAAAPPKKVGASDPYGALGGFTQLQNAYLDALARPPDYSGVEPVNYDELRRLADTSATRGVQPYIDQVQDERGYQSARRDVSNQAATNFTAALASIFTGGKPGAEGEAYSLSNFGGSYLAGVAATLGKQLMAQIGQTFNERDNELKQQLSVLMDKYPDEADKIYQDLVAGEEARVKEGRSIVDADYRSQIAALAAATKFERDNAQGAGGAGKPYVSYFTDPATGARMGVRPDGSVARISGGKAAEPMSGSQVASLLSSADRKVVESMKNGASVKKAVLDARRFLRDNGVKNYGQWLPYTTPDGPTGMKPRDFPMPDGSIWRANTDGTVTQIKPPGNTGARGTRSARPEVGFYRVRRDALAQAKAMAKMTPLPTRQQALEALWEGYGQVLLGAGFSRRKVETMLRRVLAAAAAGRKWAPADGPSYASPDSGAAGATAGSSGSGGGFDWGP